MQQIFARRLSLCCSARPLMHRSRQAGHAARVRNMRPTHTCHLSVCALHEDSELKEPAKCRVREHLTRCGMLAAAQHRKTFQYGVNAQCSGSGSTDRSPHIASLLGVSSRASVTIFISEERDGTFQRFTCHCTSKTHIPRGCSGPSESLWLLISPIPTRRFRTAQACYPSSLLLQQNHK